MSSGLTAERSINSSGIYIDVWHSLNADCFARTAEEFSIHVTIPDGLPFPYQVTNKLGAGSFGTGSCGWTTNDKSVVNGTIYKAATDGATTDEGELTLPYGANVGSPTVDNRNYQCGDGCPGTAMARFRFNVPL
jgi:hypothetical protein